MKTSAHFNPAALKFLKALRRNNDRDWFNARKDVYEAELKTPMLAVITEINEAWPASLPSSYATPPNA